MERKRQELESLTGQIEALTFNPIYGPPWGVGFTTQELIAVAKHEGANPYRMDWWDGLDSVVIREAREGAFKKPGLPGITELKKRQARLRRAIARMGGRAMRVDRVTATVRFSQDSSGTWKSLEVGAEATIAPNEEWCAAQQQLYRALGRQIKTLWASGNGTGKSHSGLEQPAPSQPEMQQPDHYCSRHRTPFWKYSKEGREWWNHRQGDGWCRES